VDVLRKSELERREIYVLSDLSMPAWRDADISDLPAKLARNAEGKGVEGENVLLQVIDVSVPISEIRNWTLANFKLSQQSTTPGSQVTISAEVHSVKGSGTEQMSVELVAEANDRSQQEIDVKTLATTTRVIDRQLLEVSDGGSLPLQMTWKDLSEGTNHAELRLTRPDPLDCDNVVYISVDARTQGQTLVICDDKTDAASIASVIDTLTPSKLCSSSELGTDSIDLTKFSCILLFDPGNVSADAVDLLDEWVAKGGGLMIVLASSFDSADALAQSPVAKLLPGKITGMSNRSNKDRSVKLSPSVKNHPIWLPFDLPIDDIPWVSFSVFRNWEIQELDDQSIVLMKLTGSELPAIVEQVRKQGRVVSFMLPTFPVPERDSASDKSWSYDQNGWFGWALLQGTLDYLGSWNSQQLNYFVDEPAVLENNTAQFPQLYKLLSPQNEETRVESSEESLVYTFTRFPGQYRLRGLRPQGPVVRGFSVNVDRKEVSLERVLPAVLDKALGKDLYRVAKDREEVQSSLGEGRYGRDLSPFLLMVFVMMIMAEQTMSSRFYAQSKRAEA
jgi:uncharacterized membrane protein